MWQHENDAGIITVSMFVSVQHIFMYYLLLRFFLLSFASALLLALFFSTIHSHPLFLVMHLGDRATTSKTSGRFTGRSGKEEESSRVEMSNSYSHSQVTPTKSTSPSTTVAARERRYSR